MMFRAVDVYIVFLHDMEYQFYGVFFSVDFKHSF